jgi:serine phosphatase RsbU (regulator of sigma subunit)
LVAANNHLTAFLPGGSFVTAAALLMDPKTGSGQCINCGHPPVFAVGPASVREVPGGENPPLGVLDDSPSVDAFQLHRGEYLFLYTDGLSEMRNRGGAMLGIQPLREQITRLFSAKSNTPAQQLAEDLTKWLDAWHGEAMADDDRTFLVARLSG